MRVQRIKKCICATVTYLVAVNCPATQPSSWAVTLSEVVSNENTPCCFVPVVLKAVLGDTIPLHPAAIFFSPNLVSLHFLSIVVQSYVACLECHSPLLHFLRGVLANQPVCFCVFLFVPAWTDMVSQGFCAWVGLLCCWNVCWNVQDAVYVCACACVFDWAMITSPEVILLNTQPEFTIRWTSYCTFLVMKDLQQQRKCMI